MVMIRSGKQRQSGRPPGRRGGGYNGGGYNGGDGVGRGGGDDRRGDDAPSGIAIFAFFVVLAVACVGGYFLVMKLIDISRQEDCMLTGRRNCVPPIELPSNR